MAYLVATTICTMAPSFTGITRVDGNIITSCKTV